MRNTVYFFISFCSPLACFLAVEEAPEFNLLEGWHPLLFVRNSSPEKPSELWTAVDQAQEQVSFRELIQSGEATFRSREIENWVINPPDKVRFICYNEHGDSLWEAIFNTTGTKSTNFFQSDRIINILPRTPYNQLIVFQNELITDEDDEILMMDFMLNAATPPSNQNHAFVFSPLSPLKLPIAELPALRPCVGVGINSVEQQILPELTLEMCLHRCVIQGFAYSMIRNGTSCSCGNEKPLSVRATTCDVTCAGDNTQICGGVNTSTLIQNTNPDTSMCFDKLDAVIINGLIKTIVNMTQEKCAAFCYQNQKEYAVVEDGNRCGCLSMVPDMPDGSLCNTPCAGNALQNCGGYNAVRLLPVKVSEWATLKCTSKLLDFSGLMGNPDFTQETCVYDCYNSGSMYAVIQKGDQCVCLDAMPLDNLVSDGCTIPCPGDDTQICGGAKDKFVIPTKRDVSCIRTTDIAQNVTTLTNMTVQKCIHYCYGLGYAYAGVTDGTQCRCYDTSPTINEKTSCTIVCSGDTSQLCGGLDAGRFFPTENNIELLAPFSDIIFNDKFSDFPVEISTAQIAVSVDGVFYMDLIEIDVLSAEQELLPMDVNIFYGSNTCEYELRWYGPNMTYQLDQGLTDGENLREYTGPLKVGCLRIEIIPATTVKFQPTVNVRLYGAQSGTFIHAPILAVDGYWEPVVPESSSLYSTSVVPSPAIAIELESTSDINIMSSITDEPEESSFYSTPIVESPAIINEPEIGSFYSTHILPSPATAGEFDSASEISITSTVTDEPGSSSFYSTSSVASSAIGHQFDSTSDFIVTSTITPPSSSMCPCNCNLYSQIMHRQTQYENLTEEEVLEVIKVKAEIVKKEVAAAINISELSSTIRKYISTHDDRTSAQTMGYVLGVALLSIFFGSIVLLDIATLSRDFMELKNKICLVLHKRK